MVFIDRFLPTPKPQKYSRINSQLVNFIKEPPTPNQSFLLAFNETFTTPVPFIIQIMRSLADIKRRL